MLNRSWVCFVPSKNCNKLQNFISQVGFSTKFFLPLINLNGWHFFVLELRRGMSIWGLLVPRKSVSEQNHCGLERFFFLSQWEERITGLLPVKT
jgi:hypothetical protein